MKILLIVNSFASSVTARNTVVVHRRLGAGHDVEVVETNRRGHATRFAHDAARRGVDVVIGTLAVREPDTVKDLCQRYPGRVIVAIDAKDGMVAVSGWTEVSELQAVELAKQAQQWGASALLFTDVARDGMQGGAAVQATADIQAAVDIPVIASGGVGSLEDLDDLRDSGAKMVVLGRALYEGNFTAKEALARC